MKLFSRYRKGKVSSQDVLKLPGTSSLFRLLKLVTESVKTKQPEKHGFNMAQVQRQQSQMRFEIAFLQEHAGCSLSGQLRVEAAIPKGSTYHSKWKKVDEKAHVLTSGFQVPYLAGKATVDQNFHRQGSMPTAI